MNSFHKQFGLLANAWYKREEIETNPFSSRWLVNMISIEKKIIKLTFGLAEIAEKNHEQLLTICVDLNNRKEQFIAFHVIFTSFSEGLFGGKESVFEPDLINLLGHKEQTCHTPILQAMTFSDEKIVEKYVPHLLAAKEYATIEIGLELVKLFSIKGHTNLLAKIFDRSLNEEEIDDTVLEAIRCTQNCELANTVESALSKKFIKDEDGEFSREDIYTTLITLGFPRFWKDFEKDCAAKELYYEAPEVIGQYGGPAQVDFIIEQLQDASMPVWVENYVMALQALGDLRAIEPIIEVFSKVDDISAKQACIDAYAWLTGQQDDIDQKADEEEPKEMEQTMNEWWEEDEEDFDLRKHYLNGEIFSIKTLVDSLLDPNSGIRMEIKQRLFAYTGECLPFNEEGFVTDMLKQQMGWATWYQENQSKFPDGYWYLGGKKLS